MNKTAQYAGFVSPNLSRKLAVALVFLFIISPAAPAFAQETGESTPPPIDQTDPGTTPPPGEVLGDTTETPATPADTAPTPEGTTPTEPDPEKVPEEPVKETPPEEEQAAMTGITGPQSPNGNFELPQNKANVDQSTGALVYEYSFKLPEGRAGMTPEFSLKYNSRNASKPDGITGLGWETSIPYIVREPVKGTDNLYTKAYFSSSLSGNLIATTDTTSSQYTLYRPEIDGGEYLKYTFSSNNTWTVTGKDGKTYTFGDTAASRQDNPTDATKIYKWMISKISDTNGNEIQYTYVKDSGQIYPSQIVYTYHPSSPAVNTIDFTYTTPTDYGSTVYNSAFPVITKQLLSNIVVKTTIGTYTSTDTYNFIYVDAQFIKQKNLSAIRKSSNFRPSQFFQDFDETTNFTYSTKTPGWELGTYSLENYLPNYWALPLGNIVHIADLDRNGYPDLLTSERMLNNTESNHIMMNNGTTFTDAYAAWSLPTYNQTPIVTRFAVVDVNGDQLPDLYPRGDNTLPLYLNNGSSFTPDTSNKWKAYTYLPDISYVGGCGPNVGDLSSSGVNAFYHDMNQDGKNDIVFFGGSSDFRVFLNNGNGFTQSTAYTFTPAPGANFTIPSGDCSPLNTLRILVDINGDGLSDFVDKAFGTYLNTGKGFAYSAAYDIDPTKTANANRLNLTDINNDGLLDLVEFTYYNNNSCSFTYINSGTGFTQVFPTSPLGACSNSGIWDAGELLYYNQNTSDTWGSIMDLTMDGFPDLVGPHDRTYIGRVRSINDSKDRWVTNPISSEDPWKPFVTPAQGLFFDINVDGVLDFITSTTNWAGGTMEPAQVGVGKSAVPNRLTKITNPLGGETVIDYATAPTNYDDTNVSPMPVVKKITTQNIGFGQPDMVTQYAYTKGSYAADPATGQRRFAGFQKVTTTESGSNLSPLRVTETYFHQANGSDSATNEPVDTSLALIGKPYYTITKGSSSTPRKETWNKYGQYTLLTEPVIGRLAKFVYPTEIVTKTTEASATTGVAEVYTFDTTLGEQTELRNMGFVTVGTNGSYTDITGDTRYQFTEYANNAGSTLVKPKRVDVRTGPASSTTVARTDYLYDNQAFGGIGTLGNLTKETKWISGNGTVTASTTYTYDSFGNVLTVTNPRGAITTYTYESTQSQIASQTNHLNQTTNYEYTTGKLSKVTDPNGRVTLYGYSNKGWLYSTLTASSSGSKTKRQWLVEGADKLWFIASDTQLVDETFERSYQSIDRLRRPVHLIRKLVNHATNLEGVFYLKQTKAYDALGREITSSAAYGTPDSNYLNLTNVVVPSNLITTTTYDVFDRPTAVTNTLGTTAFSYAGTETTTTDANNKQKKAKTDAYGNIVEVKEINGANTYTTTYAYDVRNLLTKVTDALGNLRNFTYNNAGWLTKSEDLHAPADTTFGSSSFTYDLNGNQLVETQPSGNTVARTYDMLDRATIINGSATAQIDYTLTYDTCLKGKGRLCTVAGILPNSTTLSKSYQYGISGVPTVVSIATLGNTYTTRYEYNSSDQVSKITYPNGTVVRYTFGDWALPWQTYVTLPAGVETTFATTTYNHNEQPLVTSIVSGPTTTNTYDSAKLYRKTNVTAVQSGNTLQSYAYTYDNLNNITQVAEPNLIKTYTYDDLYRLTKAVYTPTPGTPTTYTYAYNAIGNITSANGLTYTYSQLNKTNPHAVTNIGTNSYTYDANGNMITAPGQTLTYNWQNQPIRINLGGTTNIDSLYDESGERFIYKTPTNLEVQVEETYIVRNSVPEVTIKLAGTLVGTVSNNVIYSAIADHLGTPVKQINSAGVAVETVTYDPFGKIISQTGTLNTKRGYTGHEEDVDTGLVYAEARHYRPASMRFNQQDPSHIYLGHQNFNGIIGVDRNQILLDPQQLNSYSYVRNNPINGTDPTGKLKAKLPSKQSVIAKLKKFRDSFTIKAPTAQARGPVNILNKKTERTVLSSPVGDAPINSLFMADRSDCDICSKTHGGTDYQVTVGTPVHATAKGKVVRSGFSTTLGNTVVIEHLQLSSENDGVYTLYGHGSSLNVKVGQNVNVNDIVMYSGNTGTNTTGPHLHFEVIKSPFKFGSNDFYHKDKLQYRYGPGDLSQFLK